MGVFMDFIFRFCRIIHYANSSATEKLKNLDMRKAPVADIENLLKHFADPNVIMWNGNPPLVNARTFEQTALLLRYGADPNLFGKHDQSAIQKARTIEQTELLYKHGAQINHHDTFGNTPLIDALTGEQTRFLLEHGADLNHENDLYDTALLTANKPLEQVPLLLEHGANPFACNMMNQTALIMYKKYPTLIELIKKAQEDMRDRQPILSRHKINHQLPKIILGEYIKE